MYENGERIPRDGIKLKIAEYYQKSVQEIFFD
nr:MAG TPA: repressor protein C2 [Caudoviricetes sp.]